MDAETKEFIEHEISEMTRLLKAKLDNLEMAINKRFESFRKVIGDYLELSSSMSISTVKANLKSV